jgi:hypothetical protein
MAFTLVEAASLKIMHKARCGDEKDAQEYQR